MENQYFERQQSLEPSRGFSDAKRDLKDKVLISYDIYDNKSYKKILALINNVIILPNAAERQKNYVLPIETPPEKLDEMAKVVSEF